MAPPSYFKFEAYVGYGGPDDPRGNPSYDDRGNYIYGNSRSYDATRHHDVSYNGNRGNGSYDNRGNGSYDNRGNASYDNRGNASYHQSHRPGPFQTRSSGYYSSHGDEGSRHRKRNLDVDYDHDRKRSKQQPGLLTELDVMKRLDDDPEWQGSTQEEERCAQSYRATKAYAASRKKFYEARESRSSKPDGNDPPEASSKAHDEKNLSEHYPSGAFTFPKASSQSHSDLAARSKNGSLPKAFGKPTGDANGASPTQPSQEASQTFAGAPSFGEDDVMFIPGGEVGSGSVLANEDDTPKAKDIHTTILLDELTIQNHRELEVANDVVAMVNSATLNYGLQVVAEVAATLDNALTSKDDVAKHNVKQDGNGALSDPKGSTATIDLTADGTAGERLAIPNEVRVQSKAMLARGIAQMNKLELLGHSALQSFIDAYDQSDGTRPFVAFPFPGLASPLDWASVKDFTRPGRYLRSYGIDILLNITQEKLDCVGILTNASPIIGATLSKYYLKLSWDPVEQELQRLRSGGALNNRHNPNFPSTVDKVGFPYNPSNDHWVFVVAEADKDGDKFITIYDSYPGGHGPTWQWASKLTHFMELLGYYHRPFSGPWPENVDRGRMDEQVDTDCGLCLIKAARRVMTGRDVLEGSRDMSSTMLRYRTNCLTEICALLNGATPTELRRMQEDDDIINAEALENVAGMDASAIQKPFVLTKDYRLWLDRYTPSKALTAVLIGSGSGSLPAEEVRRQVDRRTYALGVRIRSRLSAYPAYSIDSTTKMYTLNPDFKWEDKLHENLFGDDRHVFTAADDIDRHYPLVCFVVRDSCARGDRLYVDTMNKAQSRCEEMCKLWTATFDQCPETRVEVRTADDVRAAGDSPMFCYYTVGYRSSESRIFFLKDGSQTYIDISVSEVIAEVAKDKDANILFVQCGIDALTTRNSSWRTLLDQFDSSNIWLTSIWPISQGGDNPEVWTSRNDYMWAHHQVSRLAQATEEGPESAIPQDPSHGRLVEWLYAFSEWKQSYTDDSHLSKSKRRSPLARAVSCRRNTFQLEEHEKFCEQCGSYTTDLKWLRGESSLGAVRCDRCPPTQPCLPQVEVASIEASDALRKTRKAPKTANTSKTPRKFSKTPKSMKLRGLKVPRARRSKNHRNANLNKSTPKRQYMAVGFALSNSKICLMPHCHQKWQGDSCRWCRKHAINRTPGSTCVVNGCSDERLAKAGQRCAKHWKFFSDYAIKNRFKPPAAMEEFAKFDGDGQLEDTVFGDEVGNAIAEEARVEEAEDMLEDSSGDENLTDDDQEEEAEDDDEDDDDDDEYLSKT